MYVTVSLMHKKRPAAELPIAKIFIFFHCPHGAQFSPCGGYFS